VSDYEYKELTHLLYKRNKKLIDEEKPMKTIIRTSSSIYSQHTDICVGARKEPAAPQYNIL
jgi:hypothetical protein